MVDACLCQWSAGWFRASRPRARLVTAEAPEAPLIHSRASGQVIDASHAAIQVVAHAFVATCGENQSGPRHWCSHAFIEQRLQVLLRTASTRSLSKHCVQKRGQRSAAKHTIVAIGPKPLALAADRRVRPDAQARRRRRPLRARRVGSGTRSLFSPISICF